jgi:hypothetical protein
MKTKLVAIFAACSVALGGLAIGLASWADVDNILGGYPGSVRLESTLVDLGAAARGALVRQVVYDTPAAPAAVRAWYAARLHLSWSAEVDTPRSCAWLTNDQEQRITGLRRDVSVSVCSEAHGTRIVVTERLALEP